MPSQCLRYLHHFISVSLVHCHCCHCHGYHHGFNASAKREAISEYPEFYSLYLFYIIYSISISLLGFHVRERERKTLLYCTDELATIPVPYRCSYMHNFLSSSIISNFFCNFLLYKMLKKM